MQNFDSTNTLFTLASDLVNHTSKNIFLTGKAGTGKTTFLRYIRENCPKQMAVVAPTGVAAINAGGVTIHSFFQLPLSPFIPGGFSQNNHVTTKHTLLSRLRLNSERRKIFQELELLVIDEISMVRCDVLDAIDLVLRHVRYRHNERFGGVQVLFIGDMFQLPPVVREQEWNLLRDYYNGPYFFDSHVMKDDPPLYLEFTTIYRQTEERFINLLNKVRNNEMDDEYLEALHDRYQPGFFGDRSDGYILLTTHNEKAREMNACELAKLSGRLFTYSASIDGDFPETAFPAAHDLQLKIGAQVMFIRNDTDKGKRFFNGKIGVVTDLDKEKILVQCKDEDFPVEVTKEKWQNIRYTLDRSTRQLNEDVLGSFSQYPLRLAWAITIHKSQGLTFEKAVIDAGKAFAPGQVYVALSRCTGLEGIVLHSKVNPSSLCADNRIVQFTKNIAPIDQVQEQLTEAKKAYQLKVLSSLFEFRKALNSLKELHKYLLEHASSFNVEAMPWTDEVIIKLESLQTTAGKFSHQLTRLFAVTPKAEDNLELQERLKTAANWFMNETKAVIEQVLTSPAITDSSIHAKEYNDLLREAFVNLTMQNFLLQGFTGKLNMENFHRRKKNFVTPSFPVNSYAGASQKKQIEVAHPALYFRLKKLRDNICARKNQPIYLVAGSRTLEEMTNYLPQTIDELEKISGFGKTKLDSYGNDFLNIITEYCGENNLTSNISAKTPKRKRKETREPKVDTKAETFKLYQQGKTTSQIASERKLTTQTIEGHLAYYVEKGFVKVEDLLTKEKILLIEVAIKEMRGASLTQIKDKLSPNVSFGEIRLVLASLNHRSGKQ
ncbi:MAG: helix-turn-helix domain-containing protein [Flavisolibacter sp.]